MCDTLVALPGATAGGGVVFGKNSDRERNEAQGIERLPARVWAAGDAVRCTYIAIPQAARTHACLISRPYWMWGAEMGANAHGLVIGNEALSAVVPAPRRRALTGMDLLRLALERAVDAEEAVQVITTLLERYGQGGDCGHYGRFYYHNAFLIADRRRAVVLETLGRDWAVKAVERTQAISNAYGLGADVDALSPGLRELGRARGWAGADGRFDLSRHLTDPARDAVSKGTQRCARGGSRLAEAAPRIDMAAMAQVLRDHGPDGGRADWTPATLTGRTICMHAGPGDRRSQSVGAMISELGPQGDLHWVTGTSAPCLSLFRPVLLEDAPEDLGGGATDRRDAASLWWRGEALHRAALADYPRALALVQPRRDQLEADFRQRMAQAALEGPDAIGAAAEACWREADAALARWTSEVRAVCSPAKAPAAYVRSWGRLNRAAESAAPPTKLSRA